MTILSKNKQTNTVEFSFNGKIFYLTLKSNENITILSDIDLENIILTRVDLGDLI